MIISGSASQSLAAALSAILDQPLAPVTYDQFPDGELLTTTEFQGNRALIVAATTSSKTHIELLQLQDAARTAGASEITTIIPYLGYARQDEAFAAGEPISARAVAEAISPGSDQVIVVNPHADTVCDFFTPPAEMIDAASLLAQPLPVDLSDPLFLAPDENALSLAETVRDAYDAGSTDYFEKTRLSDTAVEIAPSDAEVSNRDVVVVDDIIATGGTMSEAIGVLTDRDADRIYATCVHPVLAKNARLKLARAGVTNVYGTDTLERAETAVSVAPKIAEAL